MNKIKIARDAILDDLAKRRLTMKGTHNEPTDTRN